MAIPAIRRLLALKEVLNLTIVVATSVHACLIKEFIGNSFQVICRFDGKRMPQIRLWVKLLCTRPDLIIAPLLSDRLLSKIFFASLFSDVIVPSGAIKRQILFVGRLKVPLSLSDMHQVDYIVRFIGYHIKEFNTSRVLPHEILLDRSKQKPMPRQQSRPPRLVFGISCGLMERHKVPKPKTFATLANKIARYLDYELVIIGDKNDSGIIEELVVHLDPRLLKEVIVDRSIGDTIRYIAECDLGITGTTGQGHMMAASGLPMVILAGVTNPHESAPFAERAEVIRHNLPCGPCYQESFRFGCGKYLCMDSINLDEIVAAVMRIITNSDQGRNWWQNTPKLNNVNPILITDIQSTTKVMPVGFAVNLSGQINEQN